MWSVETKCEARTRRNAPTQLGHKAFLKTVRLETTETSMWAGAVHVEQLLPVAGPRARLEPLAATSATDVVPCYGQFRRQISTSDSACVDRPLCASINYIYTHLLTN